MSGKVWIYLCLIIILIVAQIKNLFPVTFRFQYFSFRLWVLNTMEKIVKINNIHLLQFARSRHLADISCFLYFPGICDSFESVSNYCEFSIAHFFLFAFFVKCDIPKCWWKYLCRFNFVYNATSGIYVFIFWLFAINSVIPCFNLCK